MNNQTSISIFVTAILLFVSSFVRGAGVAPLLLESDDRSATILELYTSQGCSSCPPAERWLSTFVDDPSLWRDIIPINFHVDYWDYLGWKDPFARAEFSKRQRNYQQLGRTRNVATPGFVVNGRGWNGWFRQKAVPHQPGLMKVSLKAVVDPNDVSVTFDAASKSRARVHIAILGFGIKIPVKHGENRGLELAHDFVVIGYENRLLKADNGKFATTLQLPTTVNIKTKARRKSIVVWVSGQSDIAPIQVVAGWL